MIRVQAILEPGGDNVRGRRELVSVALERRARRSKHVRDHVCSAGPRKRGQVEHVADQRLGPVAVEQVAIGAHDDDRRLEGYLNF